MRAKTSPFCLHRIRIYMQQMFMKPVETFVTEPQASPRTKCIPHMFTARYAFDFPNADFVDVPTGLRQSDDLFKSVMRDQSPSAINKHALRSAIQKLTAEKLVTAKTNECVTVQHPIGRGRDRAV